MADFNYTVKKNDRGLTYIFLNEAEKNGYTGDSKKINWQNVLSVFDQIQEEEKAEGQKLYSGGNDKTKSGWGNSYVINPKQVIELTKAQLDKIYKAMGFTKKGDTPPANQDVAPPANQNTAPPANNGPKTPANNQVQADAASVKVNVIDTKHVSEGANLAEALNNGKTDGITPENVAYAVEMSTINFSARNVKQTADVYRALTQRLKDLNLLKDNEKSRTYTQFSKLPYTEQDKIIREYSKRIIETEKELLKIQKTFDDANQFLAEVANMDKSKLKIKSGHYDQRNYDWKCTILPDGRWIEVRYDNKGEIKEILISHDTTPDKISDGTTSDRADVSYKKVRAAYDYDKNNDTWEGEIDYGYDFEKLKALAEKIFGKNTPET